MIMKERETKDKLLMATACLTLASGIVLAFLSFFLSNEHAIHDSVLWYFAQCLIYAGSALGIATYVDAKLNDYHGKK